MSLFFTPPPSDLGSEVAIDLNPCYGFRLSQLAAYCSSSGPSKYRKTLTLLRNIFRTKSHELCLMQYYRFYLISILLIGVPASFAQFVPPPVLPAGSPP